MALNPHERDVINALILRVNDLTWEIQRLQGQGEKFGKALPFKWLRRRMGFEIWPMLYEYPELHLFVDAAPEVDAVSTYPEESKVITNARFGKATPRNLPGYYERRPNETESLFIDSEDDTGA